MLKSVAKVLLGNVASGGLNFVYLYLLAKILEEGQFGSISLVLYLVAIANVTMNFGGNTALVSYVNGGAAEFREDRKLEALSITTFLSAAIGGVVIVVLLGITQLIPLTKLEFWFVIGLGFLTNLFGNLSQHSKATKTGRHKTFGWS